MKDRYAAAWATDCERHKGKRIGTAWAKIDDGSGDLTLTADFLDLPAIVRADILVDIKGLIDREYELAVLSIFKDLPEL